MFESVVLLTLSVGMALHGLAQERVVEVKNLDDWRLERTARHLGVTPTNLLATRRILEDSVEALSHYPPGQPENWHLQSLAQEIGYAWPLEEQALFDRVAERLRRVASETTAPQAYAQATLAVLPFLFPRSRGGEGAVNRARGWPRREDLGERAQEARRQLLERAETRRLEIQSSESSDSSLDLVRQRVRRGQSYQLGELLQQLLAQGRGGEAEQEVREALDRLAYSGDNSEVWNFANNFSTLAVEFPELFAEAYRLWLSRIPEEGDELFGITVLRTRLGEVELSSVESAMWQSLQYMSSLPESTLRAFRLLPESLQGKIQQVGGLDRALRGDQFGFTPGGNLRPLGLSHVARSRSLFPVGWATRDPGTVQRRLNDEFPGPDDFSGLMRALSFTCQQDADFSRLGLRHAGLLMRQHTDLESRVKAMTILLLQYGQCEGEAPPDRLAEARRLLEDAREEAAAVSEEHLSRLETTIVKIWGLTEPDDARRFLGGHPDPTFRFNTLLALARERLKRRYGGGITLWSM